MLSPKEIVEKTIQISISKSKFTISKLFILGVLAGMYIAIGGLLAISVGGGIPEIQAQNPGLQKFIFGAVFPLGLILVVVAGAELFTGNTAILFPAFANKKINFKDLFKNWIVVYLGNFLGSIVVAYFFAYQTHIFDTEPWINTVNSIAEKKVTSNFSIIFFKGIACNWLVCLAVWLSFSAKSLSGKILGVWFPIMGFVAIGFEHCVANMFFVPTSIFYGSGISWLDFFSNNLVAATLGNIVGGSFFVGFLYSFVYSKD